jgi:hypothetical protein
MKQWDIQQQVFKTSRLIKHQEYGTYESNRGNISGRPSPSNSTPMTLHELPKPSMKLSFLLIFFFKIFFVFHIESIANPNPNPLLKAPNQSSTH